MTSLNIYIDILYQLAINSFTDNLNKLTSHSYILIGEKDESQIEKI